jgi:hypothetical protein
VSKEAGHKRLDVSDEVIDITPKAKEDEHVTEPVV